MKNEKLIVPKLIPQFIPIYLQDDEYLNNLYFKNVFVTKHNRYTPPFEHKHSFFELVYVLTGSCINSINEKRIQMKEGDLCLLSPSISHYLVVNDDSLIINILMRTNAIDTILLHTLNNYNLLTEFFLNSLYQKDSANCLIFNTSSDNDIREFILDMFLEKLSEDEYSEQVLTSILIILFAKLVRSYQDSADSSPSKPPTYEVSALLLPYIEQHCDTVSLSEIAKIYNYSILYCSRYIKKLTGYTFSQLLHKIRFRKAEYYLLNTTIGITQISHLLGYENPENFIRAFKQKYHITVSVTSNTPIKNTPLVVYCY